MKILIVDDEISILTSLQLSMQSISDQVLIATSGQEALDLFETQNPDIMIIDINLPDLSGLDVLKEVKAKNEHCICIMITYLSEVKIAVDAMKLGAFEYFTKPFSLEEVKETVIKAKNYIEQRCSFLEKVNQDQLKTNLIGKSKSIQFIKDKLSTLADLPAPTNIMIQGESGTGKEVVARYLHSLMKKKVPFVAVNCAAIPETLQESELFGYEKGSFTDAKSRKIGLIEQSNGGVLFLDEIGDMNLTMQSKVLRVLQEKSFRRIGGTEEISFESMVIGATNRDITEMVKKGSFREDLFFRINVIPIQIKPLRERKEDIPLLLDYFIQKYNQKLKKEVHGIDDQALKIFTSYHWPGNVRELKNILEYIMVFLDKEMITKEDIPTELFLDNQIDHQDESQSLSDFESKMVLDALVRNNWNITHTAEELNMSRFTLRKRIQKYDLSKNW